MAIGAISQNLQPLTAAQSPDQAAFQQRMQQMHKTMAPVAQLFGETPQQLMQDLQSGSTSLSALAQSKGVSQSDLLAAIEQGLQQSGGKASSLSSAQLDAVAGMIANRTHGAHHHHGGASGVRGGGSSTAVAGAGAAGDPDGDGDHDGAAAAGGIESSTTAQQVALAQLLFQLQSADAATSTAQPSSASSWADLLATNASPASLTSQAV